MILHPIYEGPKEQWQTEMDKLSRDALLCLARSLFLRLDLLGIGSIADGRLDSIRAAKKIGRMISAGNRTDRFLADPTGCTREHIRRSKAAKKAARRRKRNAR